MLERYKQHPSLLTFSLLHCSLRYSKHKHHPLSPTHTSELHTLSDILFLSGHKYRAILPRNFSASIFLPFSFLHIFAHIDDERKFFCKGQVYPHRRTLMRNYSWLFSMEFSGNSSSILRVHQLICQHVHICKLHVKIFPSISMGLELGAFSHSQFPKFEIFSLISVTAHYLEGDSWYVLWISSQKLQAFPKYSFWWVGRMTKL